MKKVGMKSCPGCGSQVPENALFCPACGREFEHVDWSEEKFEMAKMAFKAEQQKKNDKAFWKIMAILAALVIGGFGFLYIRHDSRNRELEAISQEVQTLIVSGEYDLALIKANQLHMDDNWSDSNKERWDRERESLIQLIEKKQKEAWK